MPFFNTDSLRSREVGGRHTHSSQPTPHHDLLLTKHRLNAKPYFSHRSSATPWQTVSTLNTITEADTDKMDPAALVGWMLEGDTQPMDSQIYRDYNKVPLDIDRQPNGSRASVGDFENLECAGQRKDIQGIEDQKSPTPPGWLSHRGRLEADDELSSVSHLPAIPLSKQRLSPTTPRTVSKKRNFRGEILTPATETPGSALTALFDASALKSMGAGIPAVSLSQMFAGTQAQSSPALNDLKSDPIFQRPSPNFNRGPSASPVNIQSSPTKAVRSISPDAINAVRDAYSTLKEFQLRREQENTRRLEAHLEGQSHVESSDLVEVEEDSLHEILTAAEERMLRDRKHAQKRHEALENFRKLRAPKRLQSTPKSRTVKSVNNSSSSPPRVRNINLRQTTVSDGDRFSLRDIASAKEPPKDDIDKTKKVEGNEMLHNELSAGHKLDGADGKEASSFEPAADEEQQLNHLTHFHHLADQRHISEALNNEILMSKLSNRKHEQDSMQEYNGLQTQGSTILIPQSQPTGRQSESNATEKQNSANSTSYGRRRENAENRNAMSSSPPILHDNGEHEKFVVYQGAKNVEEHTLRSKSEQIDHGAPYKPFSPQTPKAPLSTSDKVLSTTNNDQVEASGEEQIEVPETDPPEIVSSYRSTRRISKIIESNTENKSPSQNLSHTFETKTKAAKGKERETDSANYETARSKFSDPSHLASRTQESIKSRDSTSVQISPSRDRRKSSNGLSDIMLRSNAVESNTSDYAASHSSPNCTRRRKSRRIIQRHDISAKSTLSVGRTSSSFNTVELSDLNRTISSENFVALKAYSFPNPQSIPITPMLPLARSKGLNTTPIAVEQTPMIKTREPDSNFNSSIADQMLFNNEVRKKDPLPANATELKAAYSKWAPESSYAPHRVLALFKDRCLYYWPATCLGRVNKNNPTYKIRFDDGAIDEIEAKHVCVFNLIPGDIIKVDIPTLKKNNYVVQGFEEARPPITSDDPEENIPTDIHGHESVKLALKGRHSSTGHLTTVPLSSIYLTGTMWPHYKDRLLSMGIIEGHSHAFRCLTPKANMSIPQSPSSRSKRSTYNTPSNRERTTAPLNCSNTASHLFSGMAFVVSSSEEEVKRNSLISTLNKNGAIVLNEDFDSLFSLNASQRRSFSSLFTSESLEVEDLGNLTLDFEAERYGFTALLAHEFSRRVKHMQALALGLPVLHSRWIKDCIQAQKILSWKHYILPAGKSSLLDGAIVSRAISTYDAGPAKLKYVLANRDLILPCERVLMVDPNGTKKKEPSKARVKRGESDGDRQRKYAFLTCAMGASAICRVKDLIEAKKILQKVDTWTQVHVDKNADEAKRILFSKNPKAKNHSGKDNRLAANVVVVDHEEVMQSLILGKPINRAELASR